MSYATLTVGVGFLKNLAPLVDDPQQGLTQTDVNKAQTTADTLVNAWFARFYDITLPGFQGAPMIAEIAEHIGSAHLLQFKFSRDGTGDVGLVASLMQNARDLAMEVSKTGLLDANMNLIPTLARATSRVGNIRRPREEPNMATLISLWPMIPRV